jgi:uncharacterized protein DUF4326
VITRVVNRSSGAAFDVYVGRPSAYGNRFLDGALSVRLRQYETWLQDRMRIDPLFAKQLRHELKGKVLGCWCTIDLTGKELIICHAQILARVADGVEFPIMSVRPI